MATTSAETNGTQEHQELDLNDERGDRIPFDQIEHAHDKTLIATALEDRIPILRSLEKKNVDQGYIRESRVIKGDADRLHDVILPMFQEGEQLALGSPATAVEVRSGIVNQLHNLIRRYVRDSVGPEDNPALDFENEIAQRVERFVTKAIQVAYAAGYRDRSEHPAAFALRCLGELEHKELKGAEG